MYPTLFTIGKLAIPSYTVLLDLGLILGLVLTYFEGKRVLGSAEKALDLGLWTVIGGIIGGRIGYVVANWSTFSTNLVSIVRLWEGGLAFHGAFLGGLVVILVFALLQRRGEGRASFGKLADVVVPGFAVGLTFGWLACLMGGCSYGIPGTGFLYLTLGPGQAAPTFATQIVGLAQAFILFVIFWFLRKRWPFAGAAFLMLCLLYFGGQLFLDFVRGDAAIYVAGWRLTQLIDLAVALLSAIGVVVLWFRARGRPVEALEEATVEGPVLALEGESLGGDSASSLEPESEVPSAPTGKESESSAPMAEEEGVESVPSAEEEAQGEGPALPAEEEGETQGEEPSASGK